MPLKMTPSRQNGTSGDSQEDLASVMGLRSSVLIARCRFWPPAQLCCPFTAETQHIEKAAWALDVLEDVPNVGAMREKRVDGFYQFALICKNTLQALGSGASSGGPGANSRNIAEVIAAAVECA